jgi:hypothetical protein
MNAIKTALRLALTTTVAAGMLVIHDSPAAASVQGWSWNLAHDMLADVSGNTLVNPFNNAWTFHDSNLGQLMTAMPTGACWGGVPFLTCWEDPTGYRDSAMVGIFMKTVTSLSCPNTIPVTKGVPILHPGPNSDVIVSWTNPINQTIDIQILGRFTTIDPCGPGDGVMWSVVDQSSNTILDASNMPLVSILPNNHDTDIFYITHTVNPGDTIDFIVSPGTDYLYDGTELDVLIVGHVP